MDSVIIWLLVIHLNGAFCMESVRVAFTTEHSCKVALNGVIGQRAECVPIVKQVEKEKND